MCSPLVVSFLLCFNVWFNENGSRGKKREGERKEQKEIEENCS
jgi:hypothetical protein